VKFLASVHLGVGGWSVIIHHSAFKSSFFRLLGACRLKKRILVLLAGLWAISVLLSCGGKGKAPTVSGLPNRVLASQGVTTGLTFGGLVIINGHNDSLPRIAPLGAGSSPGLMAISPTRNIAAAVDASSNTVYAINTVKESGIGSVHLPAPTTSLVLPTADQIGYAAVPSATVNGFVFQGAVATMQFASGSFTLIAVSNAQTVVANQNGTKLLVFSNDSDSITVLSPGVAVPPIDTSCETNPPNAVCTIVPGFNRPVNAIVNGNTAYVFNCGFECGGTQQASIALFDLGSLTITATVPVNGATWGFLSGTTLYVAGNGTPTGPLCSSLTNSINPKTSSTYCGTLDIVDLSTMTNPYFNNPANEIAIPDGYHDRMDMSLNGQLFIGSKNCTNIGNPINPSGEVRGCLAIYNTAKNEVVIPPDNGNVDGLQSFTSRNIEYVAQGGSLRVYDTTRNVLLINNFLPQGTINIVGYIGDVKAIDFF
jgi:hypothetical protein